MINHGANVWRLDLKFGLGLDSNKCIVDFSANVNPYGPPDEVISALQKAVQDSLLIADYPEEQAETLCSGIAASLEIGTGNVVIGNGSVELMYSIPMMLQRSRGIQKAFALIPNFTEYESAYTRCGMELNYTKVLAEDAALDALRQKQGQKDVTIIGNPNNPCGYLIKKKELLEAIDANSNRTWVIDEAFIEFTEAGDADSLVKEATSRENLIVIRSMTKIYGIAGLRLGYAVASLTAVKNLQGFMNPWRVNSLAIAAGLSALNANDFVKRSAHTLYQEAKHMFERIQSITCLTPFEPHANFLLIQIDAGLRMTAEELQKILLVKGFAIRDCSSFTGLDEYCFRVAVKLPEDNIRLIEALEDVFM